MHEKYHIIFYVSLIKNDKQKREKKLTFLNHLLALDNVFSTKSEEQEVNLVWPTYVISF
jgi:poly-beta-hydroxyalkanoate depolymerase